MVGLWASCREWDKPSSDVNCSAREVAAGVVEGAGRGKPSDQFNFRLQITRYMDLDSCMRIGRRRVDQSHLGRRAGLNVAAACKDQKTIRAALLAACALADFHVHRNVRRATNKALLGAINVHR
jgi:hypothetical protein